MNWIVELLYGFVDVMVDAVDDDDDDDGVCSDLTLLKFSNAFSFKY